MITILKDEQFRVAVGNAIDGAQKEILIMTYKMDYQGTSATKYLNEIVEALYQATRRQVKVYCILNMDDEGRLIGRINARAKRLLLEKGIQLKVGTWGRSYHSKLMIIDGSFYFLGSHNLSEASLCRNYEISLMVSDDATVKRLRDIWCIAWRKGR